MRAPAMPWIGGVNCRHLLPAAAALLVFLLVPVILWQAFYRGEVVNYGAPGNTFFTPARAVEGDTIQLCFREIDWKQLCLSTLETRITPTQGEALELDDYTIKVPGVIGPVKRKCRPWKVPELGAFRKEGPAIVSGQVRSECTPLDHWRAIKTPMPNVPLVWLRRPS
jgi:hypothetical protein